MKDPFKTAHYERIKLDKETKKQIRKLYKDSADELIKRIDNMEAYSYNQLLFKEEMRKQLKRLEREQELINKQLQSTIKDAGEKSGMLAIEAGNKWFENAGLGIKGAYMHVPRREVETIASGKLYGGNWNLTKAIWGNGKKRQKDIEDIVAKGLAQNKSIHDMAKDLERYVQPNARKPWDWSKVYPGSQAKVDYSAQRLARTMVQHTFQQSLVQQQQYNPFCQGIIWHSVGIHGRTCEECMDRDGQVFPVNALPLDHPNGLCYFTPAMDDMNTVADRLADWVNGKDDPALDNYVSNAFGFGQAKTPTTPTMPTMPRVPTRSYRVFKNGDEANDFFYYDSEKRGLLQKKKSMHGKWTSSLSEDEMHCLVEYTTDGYGDVNRYHRAFGNLEEYNKKYIDYMTENIDSALARYELKEDIQVYRAIQPEAFEKYWDDISPFIK